MDSIEKREMIDLANLTLLKRRSRIAEEGSRRSTTHFSRKLTSAQTAIFNLSKKELN